MFKSIILAIGLLFVGLATLTAGTYVVGGKGPGQTGIYEYHYAGYGDKYRTCWKVTQEFQESDKKELYQKVQTCLNQ